MKRSTKGFAHLGLLLLLLVVVVIALIGYKVVKNRQDNTTASQTSTALTNSGGTIKSTADLDNAAKTLDNQNVDSSLNPDQLNSDVSALL